MPTSQPNRTTTSRRYRPGSIRLRKCASCEHFLPAGALVACQCPECAGLVSLPLRGEGGRFIRLTAGTRLASAR